MAKVVVAGGSGFIGRALCGELAKQGYEPVVLSRSSDPTANPRQVAWDGRTVSDWRSEFEGATAVVNLSGASVASHWSESHKLEILQSRLESTRVIGKAIAESANPPKVWVNASAVGYYGDRGGETLNEDAEPGRKGDFLVDTCVAWEHEQDIAETPATRKARIRVGLAMGCGGAAFDALSTVTRFFLGGKIGSGEQFMSWIHISDLVRLFLWAIENEVAVPLNGTAPEPVTNDQFMFMMRSIMGRPWAFPVPAFLIKLVSALGGPEASLLLEGQKVVPERALAGGFEFEYPNLRDALANLIVGSGPHRAKIA